MGLFFWKSSSAEEPLQQQQQQQSPVVESPIPQTQAPSASPEPVPSRCPHERHLQSSSSSSSSSSPAAATAPAAATRPRLSNADKLLFGGATFLFFSALVTRRALHRRRVSVIPPFYTTATYHRPRANAALDALEAFNLATINVMSVAMLAVGAGMRAFEIETMDDLRGRVRGALGTEAARRSENEVEEELQEWVAGVMARKEQRENDGKSR